MPLTTAYLGLGSNVGARFEQMCAALRHLQAAGVAIINASPVYQNRAVGMGTADPFLNAVVEVRTTLQAEDLLNLCLAIETQLGRIRTQRWSPRTIDIDILIFGHTQIHTERLQLPHPGIAERDFVLQPLLDIAPELKLQGASIKILWQQLAPVKLERFSQSLSECL